MTSEYFARQLTREELGQLVPHWLQLVEHASEPNVFFEPFFFLPAYDHLRANGETVMLYMVFYGDPSRPLSQALVTGFFPITVEQLNSKPIKVHRMWRHRHCFLCTPLVHGKHAVPTLEAIAAHLKSRPHSPNVLEFQLLSGAGNFFEAFNEAFLVKRKAMIVDSITRPVWRPLSDAESYLKASQSKKGRQRVRKKWNQLQMASPLQIRVVHNPEEVAHDLRVFLNLENSSWKGETGSALICSKSDRRFIEEVVAGGSLRGAVTFYSLYQNDTPLAYHLSLSSTSHAYAFKIAHDPSFGSCSPGHLLENEISRIRHENRDVFWGDSCTDGAPSIIDRIWKDRFILHHTIVSLGGLAPHLLLAATPVWQSIKEALKDG